MGFVETARIAWVARLTWLTGVARIARLTGFALVARVTRLARFAEIAALMRLRLIFGARSFAAGGGSVLSGFRVALTVAFGAEDRAIAAAVAASVLVVVGGLSARGERGAFPALSGARFVFGREDFELGLFGDWLGGRGRRFHGGGGGLDGVCDFGARGRAGGGRRFVGGGRGCGLCCCFCHHLGGRGSGSRDRVPLGPLSGSPNALPSA